MDTTDLLSTVIQLLIPLVAGLLAWFLRALQSYLRGKEEESILFVFAQRLRAEVADYIEDAALISTGELEAFRRPDSDGGARITDAELREYSRIIARKLLSEGAGEPWLERAAKLLGTASQGGSMEAKVARAVVSEYRAREDVAKLARPRAA